MPPTILKLPLTEEEFDRKWNNYEFDIEYSDFIIKHGGGQRVICNGDTLIAAMEDGFMYDEFKATKVMNTNFTIVQSIRHDKKLGDVPRTSVKYKDETLAICEGVHREVDALEYIKVYGYLAEWTYLKYKSGMYVNWTESLRVTV
jgi:hypothetical protein